MGDEDWRAFFEIGHAVLRAAGGPRGCPGNWCAWTTFDRLSEDAGYWTAALPQPGELRAEGTADGGTWGQPFLYRELAHVIVPARFVCEAVTGGEYYRVEKTQDIGELSRRLTERGIPHRKTDLMLEIKLY